MTCVSDEIALLFVDRQLDEPSQGAVKGHIDGCAACRRLISEISRTVDAYEPPSAARSEWLGRYVFRDVLGKGAMGIVYAAHDVELDRPVAIKILLATATLGEQTRDVDRLRVQREARAMARLSHPNVVGVYDVGSVDDRVFVIMEFVDGPTLAQWLRQRRRSWRAIVETLVAAGHGLSAAHHAGLIHRDFKPDNVLLGKDRRVRVTDFGLARPLSPVAEPPADAPCVSSSVGVSLTRSGCMVGTPAYMSPEQLMQWPVDSRTDQFSFCVTLYEALYGQRPFAGDDIRELRASVCSGAHQAPSRRDVPRALWRVLQRGLEVDRAKRFASMDMLIGALEEVLRQERGVSRRSRTAIVLACLGMAGGALVLAQPGRSAGNGGTLQGALSSASAPAPNPPASLETVEHDLVLAREKGDRAATLSLLRQGGALLRSQGRLAKAEAHYNEALALARLAGDTSSIVQALAGRAGVLRELARLEEAQALYEEAKRLESVDGDRASLCMLSIGEGWVLFERGEVSRAKAAFEAGLEMARGAGDKTREAYALGGVATTLEAMGQLQAVRSQREEWLTLAMRPELASTIGWVGKTNLSVLALEEGRFADAEVLARESALQFTRAGSAVAAAHADAILAWALFEQDKQDEAQATATRARSELGEHEGLVERFHVDTITSVVEGFRDPAPAFERLASLVAVTERTGSVRANLWARYGVGRLEVKLGQPEASRTLARLADDARAKEFLTIERLARSLIPVRPH